MKTLLKYLITAIVKHPDEVEIKESKIGEVVNFSLKIHPEDIKFVIGRQGKTIRAIRNLLRLRAAKDNLKVDLNIEEEQQKTPTK